MRSRSAGRPLLVTGLPRSGTTWLARLLAAGPGTALPGREPMNPRGRQFALAGSLPGWSRLDQQLTNAQRRTLRRAYRGWEPRIYGRLGADQWRAPLPGTRVVIKDPFALLSAPTICAVTGAQLVLVYRHPGALLASYRRMGWQPDIDEISELKLDGEAPPVSKDSLLRDDVAAMAWFWRVCHQVVLADLSRCPEAVVVDHAELSRSGEPAARRLYEACGLIWSSRASARLRASGGPAAADSATGGNPLHRLQRQPKAVADSWRSEVSESDIERLEADTGAVLQELADARLVLSQDVERDCAMPEGR